MSWGAAAFVVAGVVLPLAAWVYLWRTTAKRIAQVKTFWDNPATVDSGRQARVPLALGGGALVVGLALPHAIAGAESGFTDVLHGVSATAGSAAVIIFPVLALMTFTSGTPRWLPRVTGSTPTPATISAKEERHNTVVAAVLAPMAFAFPAIGALIVSGINPAFERAWFALTVFGSWWMVDLVGRGFQQRLEVRPEGILITSIGHEYSWHAPDIECISVNSVNQLMLRDKAGRAIVHENCPLPRGQRTSVEATMATMGYHVDDTSGASSWRPAVSPVLRRRTLPLTGPRIGIAVLVALEALALLRVGAVA